MIEWKDFYTSPRLSQGIKEIKGILPDDHEYWKSPVSLGWIDANDDTSFIPYFTFKACQFKFNMVHPAPLASVIEKGTLSVQVQRSLLKSAIDNLRC